MTMKQMVSRGMAVLAVLVAATSAWAQTPPRLIPFNGVLRDAQGQPRTGPVAMTFSIYGEADGGAALWTEVQTVTPDAAGRYAVTLGSTAADALPLDLFTTGSARWLGVRVGGEAELPRVLLVSVPYALKAADADTVGGKPLSAFLLVGDRTGTGPDGLNYINTALLRQGLSGVAAGGASSGTPGHLSVFTSTTDLGDSLLYQTAGRVGVGTTAPAAPFHAVAGEAPGTFFDVYSNALTALPVVYRAARGTPEAPAAVQTDDILGGMAVRGWYGGSAFSGGRGQIMFQAAENWTSTGNGTYLTMRTVPVGALGPAIERMRVTAYGYIGFSTGAPLFPLDARLSRGNTYARFGANDAMPLFLLAGQPQIGFNVYNDGTYRYGASGAAGAIAFGQHLAGGFSISTAEAGLADAAAALTPRLVVASDGRVGIGTLSPANALDVNGSIAATANLTVEDTVSARSGQFVMSEGAGQVLRASVAGTDVLTADAQGVHAGPGLTGTPFATATYAADGTKLSGSPNIACSWTPTSADAGFWACQLSAQGTAIDYDGVSFQTVVTPTGNELLMPVVTAVLAGPNSLLGIQIYGETHVPTPPWTTLKRGFSVVIFRQ